LEELLNAGKKVYMLGCTVSYFLKDKNTHPEFQKEYEKFLTLLEKYKGRLFLLSWEDLDIVSVEKLKK
jgi:predicted secreted hydrolase